MPEGTTFWGVVVKQVLLGASAFSTGVLLYRALFYERHRHRPFLAVGFTGVAIALSLIAELVVRAPLVDPDWRALLYVTALFLIGVGFLGDAMRDKTRDR